MVPPGSTPRGFGLSVYLLLLVSCTANTILVQDQKAYVGRLFSLQVEQNLHIQMVETYKTILPDWLTFDSKLSILSGIASLQYSGIDFSIDVTSAVGNILDTFTISVTDELPPKKPDSKTILCDLKASATIATVLLGGATPYADLSAVRRVSILQTFASLPMFKDYIDPIGFKMSSPTPNVDTELVSGPGDYKKHDVTVEVSWVVGCSNVAGHQVKLLQSLEKKAINGDLSSALSEFLGNGGVIGWRVVHVRSKVNRVRRSFHAKPTPTLGIVSIPVPKLKSNSKVEEKKPVETNMAIATAAATTTTTTQSPRTAATTTTATTTTKRPRTKKPKKIKKLKKKTKSQSDTKIVNTFPKVLNKIPPIKIYSGDLLNYRIPMNTFTDTSPSHSRKIGTRKLRLSLQTLDGLDVTDTWLAFDSNDQRLIGQHINTNEAGMREYKLVATDDDNQQVSTPVVIILKNPDRASQHNHEFSMRLLTSYEDFLTSLSKRLDIAHKLSRAFGDSNTDNIRLVNARKGSLVYIWTNTSLSNNKECPTKKLNLLADRIVKKKKVNEDFAESMDPYIVTTVSLKPKGICEDKYDGVDTKIVPENDPAPRTSDASLNHLLTFIVPIVVVIAVFFVVAVFICVLLQRRRNRRRRKLALEHGDTFIKKSVPVILAGDSTAATTTTTTSDPRWRNGAAGRPLIAGDSAKSYEDEDEGRGRGRGRGGGGGGGGGEEDTDSERLESPPPPTYAASPSLQRQQQRRLLAAERDSYS